MNTHPIPPAPELKDLASYLDKLPPMISRKKVAYFTGGAVSPKKLANWQGHDPPVGDLLHPFAGDKRLLPALLEVPVIYRCV